jgi:STE24 endopeptidase
MNPYLIFILAVLLTGYLLNLLVSILEVRSLQPELPAEFADVYDRDKYSKSQQYTRTTTRFSTLQDSFMTSVTVIFILVGGFNQIDLLARGFGFGAIGTGLLFTGGLMLLSFLVGLPFSIYSTFVIEERFGFNKTTARTFVLDILKGILLSAAIGGPLLAAVLWFFQAAGNMAWLYCWLAVTGFTLVLQFLAPVLIMPLFNRFTPLEDGELKQSITDYAREQNFAMKGIYTMDGSKRSTRLNAFFTGFGRFRRIVFFDTLVDKLKPGEIVAVLAHEMGHFKHKHIFKMMAASILQTGVMFFILSLFLGNEQLFAAFGMDHVSIYAGLVFFGFLYAPVSTLLSIFFNFYSRKNEYEADNWAVTSTGQTGALISGLKKLSVHNLANLTPHPFNVVINYSHPPILQRIAAIKQLAAEN